MKHVKLNPDEVTGGGGEILCPVFFAKIEFSSLHDSKSIIRLFLI
jgi:hypothetical protein